MLARRCASALIDIQNFNKTGITLKDTDSHLMPRTEYLHKLKVQVP